MHLSWTYCCTCLKTCHLHSLRKDVSGWALGVSEDATTLCKPLLESQWHGWPHDSLKEPVPVSRGHSLHSWGHFHPTCNAVIRPHYKLDPLIWVKKKIPTKTGWRRGGKYPSCRAASRSSLPQGGQGCAENTKRPNSLSHYCCKDRAHGAAGSAPPASPATNCEDLEGLWFWWLLLVPLTGARLGTETRKEMRTEVSQRYFFLACHSFTQHLITSFYQPFSSSVQIWVVALSERRRAFYWWCVTSNQDRSPSIVPNVAAGASALAQERSQGGPRGRGQPLI